MTLRQHIRYIAESLFIVYNNEVKRDREGVNPQILHLQLKELSRIDDALEKLNINPDMSKYI